MTLPHENRGQIVTPIEEIARQTDLLALNAAAVAARAGRGFAVAEIAELGSVIGSIAAGASEQFRDLTQVTLAISRLNQMALRKADTGMSTRLPDRARRQAA